MGAKLCPCCSGKMYKDCCEPFLEKMSLPSTAEELMRSRYTAYTLKDEDYLLRTWAEETQPRIVEFERAIHWIGLKVLETNKLEDDSYTVRFIAKYKLNGKAFRLEENSLFNRVQSRWYYIKGVNE